ncbi:phospholipase D-like domain-containing protein [Citrobacter freundii]|uniref:phospholipase D-like domain-containing protein n=1 Tax=Citrobacter freundii TaxID=546 RepID=UPI003C6C9AAA
MRKGAVIFLTGLLALSSLPSMAGDSPSVQVGFSPEGSAQTLVIGAIDSAQSSIRMMAYSFTAMDIMQALVKAKNRGVDVKIVIDERGNRNDVSHRAMKFIVKNEIPLRVDSDFPIRGGKREPQKIPPFRIVEFFGGVVRGMTTRQRLPHLSEALWRDAETPGNSATPVPGPQ